jgi:hypothetical protein
MLPGPVSPRFGSIAAYSQLSRICRESWRLRVSGPSLLGNNLLECAFEGFPAFVNTKLAIGLLEALGLLFVSQLNR